MASLRPITARTLIIALALGVALTPACKKKEEPKSVTAAASSTVSSGSPSGVASAAAPTATQRATSAALSHLPKDCDVIARADMIRLFANPVVGKQLLAGLGDESQAPKAPNAAPQGAAERAFLAMLTDLKVQPRRDLKDVVACMVRRGETWRFVAALGGEFPLGVADAMQRHAPGKEKYTATKIGEQPAIERDGKWLTQAQDHTILFGDDLPLLTQALSVQEPGALSLMPDQDIAVVAGAPAFAALQLGPGELNAVLQRAKHTDFGINMAQGRIATNLTLASEADATTLTKALKESIAQLSQDMRTAPPMMRAVIEPWVQAMSVMKLEPTGAQLALVLQVPPGTIEGSLQQLMMMSMMSGGMPAGGLPQMGMPQLGSPGLGGPGLGGPGLGGPGQGGPGLGGPGTGAPSNKPKTPAPGGAKPPKP